MRKLAAVFFSACACVLMPCAAESADWHFSVEPLFGMRYGEINEYVFWKDSNYSSDKLSELNWEIKPTWYLGARVNGGWKRLEASTSLTAALPMRTGYMYDSDWQNLQCSDSSLATYKTNYSESDNVLESDVTWTISGGYVFEPLSFLRIKPFLALDYDYIKFTGKDGTYWYGNTIGYSVPKPFGPWYAYDDSGNRSTGTFSGDVISYERQTYITWIGVTASFSLSHTVSFSIGGQIAPYIYTLSIDQHFLTRMEYADVVYDYFSAYKFTSSLRLAFSDSLALCLYGDYFFYFQPLRGYDYYKIIDESSYTKASDGEGGASAWYLDLSLSLKYTFF